MLPVLNTLQNATNKDKQSKSNKKPKHINFSTAIFIRLIIPAGKKYINSKNQLVKAIVKSGASDSILTKAKVDKLPVRNINQEQQWSTAAGVLATSTITATSFKFPELHANKLINQSPHIVDLNIGRYDMNIGRYLMISLGIDILCADMKIHWDDDAIPWSDVDSTTKNIFPLL